jgi:pimeloyl-ACP methyl ester carboxylesterase
MPVYHGVDGAALHYDVLGEPSMPPLIVLAGGAAAHPRYLGDLAGLSGQHQLIVPHLRGVGRSRLAPLGERGSRWHQAEDMDLLRAHLDLDRCAVVAHSAGTRLAIAHATSFPGHLAALVLIAPPTAYLVDVPSRPAALEAARMTEPAFAAAVSAFEAGPDTSGDETFNEWQRAIAPRSYAQWNETAQTHARSMWYFMNAARAFMSGDAPADLAHRVRGLKAPTLVIAGAQDATLHVAAVAALTDRFPAGRLAVIDDCGHFPWIEQPARFREAVDPFLDQLSREHT